MLGKTILPIEKQKIDNVAVNQAVNHIANRAADNHGSSQFAPATKLITPDGTGQIQADNDGQS